MKKVLIVMIVALLVFAMAGCSGGAAPTPTPIESVAAATDAAQPAGVTKAGSGSGAIATKAPSADKPAFDSDAVLSKLEVTERQYISDNYYYIWLVVKNNSEVTTDISGEVTFLDADGKLVGTSSQEMTALEPGCESAMTFQNDVEFATYDYQLKASESKYFDGILSKLTVDVSPTEKKAVISITNNGDKPAKFVEYIALFLKGDEIVGQNWGYCVDDDSEIKPGETQRAEASSYGEDFDSVQVYLNGRAEK